MGVLIILFIVGGTIFIYFNARIICKINLSASFATISIIFKVFKNEHDFYRKVLYAEILRTTPDRYSSYVNLRSKRYYPYLKHLRKIARFFMVKNISLYPECIGSYSSFAVEFMVVNNIIKRPLINK